MTDADYEERIRVLDIALKMVSAELPFDEWQAALMQAVQQVEQQGAEA